MEILHFRNLKTIRVKADLKKTCSYLESLNSIHLLEDEELMKLVEQSDNLNNDNSDLEFDTTVVVLAKTSLSLSIPIC